jgi:hypothetical protein
MRVWVEGMMFDPVWWVQGMKAKKYIEEPKVKNLLYDDDFMEDSLDAFVNIAERGLRHWPASRPIEPVLS